MAESEKTYNFGSPHFDVFNFARYRGFSYFVEIKRNYHERSYRPMLDYISSYCISDQEDQSGVPWFYFEYHSQNMFSIARHELYTDGDIVEWFEKATPEEIDEVAFEIKEAKSVNIESPYEIETKKLLKKILNEEGNFVDWGGETDDLFSTRFIIKGKRLSVAFGLKGRGTTGILYPGKMGKNGDQVQRLFKSPADVFIIQYNGQIHESVIDQMKSFATALSATQGKKIYFGTIDGGDTSRLFSAYRE